MNLLVTGASGFLGRYVVAEALRHGHAVRAMVRPASGLAELPWRGSPSLTCVRADLRVRKGLVETLSGVDAVIHLAAVAAGDVYAQLEGTVVTTENLLAAMSEAGVRRLVGISSLIIYDYQALPSFAELDEVTPLVDNLGEQSAYVVTKRIQEKLIREHAEKNGWDLTVLRPGHIYGPDKTWTPRLGLKASARVWLRIGHAAQVPVTYVENCAEAIVLSAEKAEAIGQTFNIIDSDPPTQSQYMRKLRAYASPKPVIVPVPWTVMRAIAAMASLTNRALFRGHAKVPGLLKPVTVHTRFKPLRYPNARIKDILDWAPRYTLDEALMCCLGGEEN